MGFGIKKGSSKEITLDEISQRAKAKLNKIKAVCGEQKPSTTEVFIEVCYELAEEKNMKAIIHLDTVFPLDGNNDLSACRLLNVLFRKNN